MFINSSGHKDTLSLDRVDDILNPSLTFQFYKLMDSGDPGVPGEEDERLQLGEMRTIFLHTFIKVTAEEK